jgi:hypothetical protein
MRNDSQSEVFFLCDSTDCGSEFSGEHSPFLFSSEYGREGNKDGERGEKNFEL